MSIQDNLQHIKDNLPSDVTLVAVSKTKPADMIFEAYNAGQRDFGENYVQELCDKFPQLPGDIRWHFIGHLQTNKVKYIISFVHLIHGVDSFKLLKEINKQALKIEKKINCLLQLHVAIEETKFGFSFTECEELLKSGEFKNLTSVNVIGFMGMASNTENKNQIKSEFESIKKFKEKMSPINPQLSVLSFGMSGDYPLAIDCGSTMIRVGSAIFGSRN
ncbi:MAG: YggS family pyridoxal phosphate-dependent enzyme [Bacteroidetes bacterium]|nr:YggS family pyridoxal phosphate-dependent enzyme [Bacteroidota bacterium]